MKSVLPKIALVIVLILVAIALAVTVPRLLQPAPTTSSENKYSPMIRSTDSELLSLLNKADKITGVDLLSAQRELEDKVRVAGIADTREKVSEYVGALERIGLRNYVIEIEKSPEPTIQGFGFVITGKLAAE